MHFWAESVFRWRSRSVVVRVAKTSLCKVVSPQHVGQASCLSTARELLLFRLVMDVQRPHSAPLGERRHAPALSQHRPQSAVQEKLSRELAIRSKRIKHLEERLRTAKESMQAHAHKRAERYIRRSEDGAETFFDGWVSMDEQRANEMDGMQRGIRCANA